MSTTRVTPTQLSKAGTTVTKSSPDSGNGNSFQNDGRVMLVLSNEGAATDIVCTITTPQTSEGLAVADRTVSMAANSVQIVGPFDPAVYNAASGTDQNCVTLTWAGTLTSMKFWLIQP